MVAQLLGLRLRLLANVFRRSPWQVFGMVLGLVVAGAAVYAATAGILSLRLADADTAGTIVVAAGSLLILGFLLVPLVLGAGGSIDPRALGLLGIPHRRLALGLAAAAFLGVPALAVAVIAVAQVTVWTRGAAATAFAVASALLLVITCILGSRVSATLASLLLSTRRAREATALVGLVVLSALAPIIALMVTLDWQENGLAVAGAVAEVTAWTPLGAVWSAPALAAAGQSASAFGALGIAVGFIALLWLAWRGLIALALVTRERVSRARRHRGLGWFGRLPARPGGVVAARSLIYWGRDARYGSSLVIVPIVPAVIIGVLVIAGVPVHFLTLLPVPIMCLFLAWSTVHNDVAYDNTAVWLHVAANIDGAADRAGRIVPPLALGILVIAAGTPMTVWAYGSAEVAPSLIGVALCTLLAGLGLSSVISAAFPYPAVHPGESPFAQPQSNAGGASWVQGLSLLGVLLLTSPTVYLAVLGIAQGGPWHVRALAAGIGTGVVALAAGILVGGLVFEKRGPELLAFTARY